MRKVFFIYLRRCIVDADNRQRARPLRSPEAVRSSFSGGPNNFRICKMKTERIRIILVDMEVAIG